MRSHTLALIALASILSIASAQSPLPAKNLDFEVASIHPAKPGQPGGGIKPTADGDGYTTVGASVRLMISLMYRIPMRQIKGLPSWAETDGYNVEAKADKKYSVDELHVMFQHLLADRFKLQFHVEKKEANAYLLTIDKGGLKMKPNTTPEDYAVPISGAGIGSLKGVRVDMRYLCWNLGQLLQDDERPVVDLTGLIGYYNFTLTYVPQNIPEQFRATLPQETLDRPSLFDAVRDQLGLKLTAGKGPVEYFVIDHVERPSEN